MIPLCYDECVKIMFGNPKHLKPLTLLLSKTLGVDYEDLEGRISLVPTGSPNDVLGYKKTDRDIVVYIKNEVRDKIIIEVNMSDEYYDAIMNKSLYYLAEVFGTGLEESKKYDNVEPTFLICFNTFYVDNIHKKMFDEYYFRNEEGYILTEKERILNINIVDCYQTWYNGTYKSLTNSYQRDLLLLCAAMYTKKKDEFEKCLSEMSTEIDIKKEMKEVCIRMNEDEELKVRYYDFLEETKALNAAIIRDEKRKARIAGLEEGRQRGRQEGKLESQKEIIQNMYHNNMDINLIKEITKLPIEDIKKIIEDIKE